MEPIPRTHGDDAELGMPERHFLATARAAARRVLGRSRVHFVLDAATRGSLKWALFLVPLALGGWALRRPTWAFVALAALGVVLVARALWAFRRAPRLADAARALDQQGTEGDRVRLALAWSEQLDRGESLDPYYVVALRRWSREPSAFPTTQLVPRIVPREAWQALGLGVVLVLVAFVRRPAPEPTLPPRPPVPAAAPALLPPAELEAVRAEVDRTSERMQSAAGKELAEELERLARGLGESGLSAEDAFRRIAELEAEVAARAAERQAWLDGLAARGAELEKSGLSRQVGRELRARRPEDAAESLQKLAERLESKTEKLSEKELAELRSALEAARPPEHVVTEEERRAQAEKQRAEATRDRLLQKKQEGALSDREASDLEQAERELKRLERRKSGGAQSELSELDKELLEAAKQLRDEQRKSAGESLERAEKKFRQGAQRSLSEADKKEMLERLRQMKETLRRQREEGSDARERFERRARGEKSESESGAGEPGEGEPGGEGSGEGEGAGSMPIPLPVPGGGNRPGATAGAGEGEARPQPGAGSEPGTSHDPNVAGDRTQGGQKPGEATMAVAQDSGEGATATETIRTAAEAGFTRPSYEKLYRSYETVAEEVIEREKIPPGYRSHVERYFQLIRPRTSERKKP